MATRSMVLEQLSTSMGLNPMTMERTLRVLGIAGLIPSLGRGKRSGEFGAAALKTIVLGAMAPSPGEAADVAVALDALRFRPNMLAHGTKTIVNGTPVGVTLGSYVQDLIERLSDPEEGKTMLADGADHHYAQPLEIVAEFEPAQAYVTRRLPGRDERVLEMFTQPQSLFPETQPGLQHGSKLRLSVLVTAGDLLRDTLAKQGVLIPESSSGRDDEGSTTPETKKASGTGIHEGLQSGNPVPEALRPMNKAQCATDKGSKQLSSNAAVLRSQVRHQPAPERTRHHAHWTDAAPP